MTTIQLQEGTDIVSLRSERNGRLEYSYSKRLAEMDIPNRLGNVLQDLGTESAELVISGFLLPTPTWATDIVKLFNWYYQKKTVIFTYSGMPAPMNTLTGRVRDFKPVIRVGENDFVTISLRLVEG